MGKNNVCEALSKEFEQQLNRPLTGSELQFIVWLAEKHENIEGCNSLS
ncbi:hypothetical protein [Alteribacillus sp. HJP-4]